MQEQPHAVTSQFTQRWTWNKAAPNHVLFDRTLRVMYRTVLHYKLNNPENVRPAAR